MLYLCYNLSMLYVNIETTKCYADNIRIIKLYIKIFEMAIWNTGISIVFKFLSIFITLL